MTSSGSTDPDWLVKARKRSLDARQDFGEPGPARWRVAASQREDPTKDDDEEVQTYLDPRAEQSRAHNLVRSDLGSGMAYFEPAASTLIVEGRPTQVNNAKAYDSTPFAQFRICRKA